MQGILTLTLAINGVNLRIRKPRDGSGNTGKSIPVPKAFAGTIAAGVVTAPGHTILAGQNVAVFWEDAEGNPRRRYGIPAGQIMGNEIPVTTGGQGNDLPAAGDVTICPAVVLTPASTPSAPALNGLQLLQFAAGCSQQGVIQFFSDAGQTQIYEADAPAANEGEGWCQGGAAAVPFAGVVQEVHAYNASPDKPATWTIAALLA